MELYLRGKVKKLRRLEECSTAQAHKEVEKKRKFADRILVGKGFRKKKKKDIIVWVCFGEQDISLF